jgi:threonine synthase
MFSPGQLAGRPWGVWRYREALGLQPATEVVTLGEGGTPLVAANVTGQRVLLKLDYLCPTGSYKDRGATVLVSKLREWGVSEIVEDSSGNAGAAVAAYAAAAGIAASIFVPAHTSAGKAAQIVRYGAQLVRVPGPREATTQAALAAAERSFYASHNWSPYFHAGVKTLAYEIAEQLQWTAPDWIVTPLGGGSLVTGMYQGFGDLRREGIIGRLPRFAAVQSERCAPVYHAWRQGLKDVPPVEKQDTAAEGIALTSVVKGPAILEALRGANSVLLTVSDAELWMALEHLAGRGFYVEPTSAVAVAALPHLRRQGLAGPNDRVVVVLTGSGLKATDKIVEHFQRKEADSEHAH